MSFTGLPTSRINGHLDAANYSASHTKSMSVLTGTALAFIRFLRPHSFIEGGAGARCTYLQSTVVLLRGSRTSSCVHRPASHSSNPLISKQLLMHASARSLSKRRRPSWRISRLLHFAPSLPLRRLLMCTFIHFGDHHRKFQFAVS